MRQIACLFMTRALAVGISCCATRNIHPAPIGRTEENIAQCTPREIFIAVGPAAAEVASWARICLFPFSRQGACSVSKGGGEMALLWHLEEAITLLCRLSTHALRCTIGTYSKTHPAASNVASRNRKRQRLRRERKREREAGGG